MIRLRQVPDEDVYVDFAEEICLGNYEGSIVIAGRSCWQSFGDRTLVSIVEGRYYDEDLDENGEEIGYDYGVVEELEKVTGKKWNETCMTGYSQGEWQQLYYTDDVSKEECEEIEDFYMGKVNEFVDEDACHYFVPHDVVWNGKKAICEYLGFNAEETVILKTTTSRVVYDYEELD